MGWEGVRRVGSTRVKNVPGCQSSLLQGHHRERPVDSQLCTLESHPFQGSNIQPSDDFTLFLHVTALLSLMQAPFSKSLSLCGNRTVLSSYRPPSSWGFRCAGERLPTSSFPDPLSESWMSSDGLSLSHVLISEPIKGPPLSGQS